ncbi:MAG: LuxR C-terminal-related transcriptional regulator [Xanthobacteraceae bacterium]|nr:LuxR C-terminal-related transcriptional regulator [Xanthobacteraceae bacterium]
MVFILDDDAQIRAALVNLCQSVDLPVLAFASAHEFLDASLPDVPSCLILDVRFPGAEPSGLEFQRTLAAAGTILPIIFITGHGDVPMSVQAMKAGAVEFLIKPVREQELLDAVQKALERDREQRRDREVQALIRSRYDSLTAREREIMHLVARGLLNKQIAAELGLSEVTVKAHRGHIMEKMHASSLAQLVRMSDQLALNTRGAGHGAIEE